MLGVVVWDVDGAVLGGATGVVVWDVDGATGVVVRDVDGSTGRHVDVLEEELEGAVAVPVPVAGVAVVSGAAGDVASGAGVSKVFDDRLLSTMS